MPAQEIRYGESNHFEKSMKEAIDVLVLAMMGDGWIVEEIRALSLTKSTGAAPQGSEGLFPKVEMSEPRSIPQSVLTRVESFRLLVDFSGNYSVDSVKIRYCGLSLTPLQITAYWPKVICTVPSEHENPSHYPSIAISSGCPLSGVGRNAGIKYLTELDSAEEMKKMQRPTNSTLRFWSTVMDMDTKNLESIETHEISETITNNTRETEPQDEKKPHRCQRCPSRFKRKRNLSEHVALVHEKKRPFACSTCDMRFGKRSNLSKHIRIVHERQRPFSCEICGSSFGQQSNVQSHIRTVHNGERPFHCSICPMAFGQKSALTTHVRAVHRREKPFSCNECGGAFGHKGDLNRHVRAVHQKKRIRCEEHKSPFGRNSASECHNTGCVHGSTSTSTGESLSEQS
uniref:C2H2-type domain-containing protein n=1 Tax=Compsopogon caeruleus TaxID=31354 RepID=A0A7S1XBV5_9RHOD|mmetsp:Transcript_12045/g.24528  ORF Transcript_12045/g.24528 Transcript_12045/m.24528 type:complete len:400 (+) Transcript_12045:462-1661(+)|eukprot:CAMPEP_0184681072 /NCGR_PEP_ID=MMETSP0312-20130426/4033_1 /TAXON_ID=31354 /ORGANISM="Compsopogon coeruleus, Strain SAG 36.94" /LENGTH=399 /DNA_ID=CAMNT_0027131671 /DNA_START=358 /DNA_END=1557 /DNA_ORIENTATION=+